MFQLDNSYNSKTEYKHLYILSSRVLGCHLTRTPANGGGQEARVRERDKIYLYTEMAANVFGMYDVQYLLEVIFPLNRLQHLFTTHPSS